MTKKILKYGAWATFYVLSCAFAYNSGKKDTEIWWWRHRTFDHAMIIRPQFDSWEKSGSSEDACTISVEPHSVITVMADGHVEYNLSRAKTKNCNFRWVVTERNR